MENDMKELTTRHLVLHYQDGLENFVKDSLNIVETKLPFIKELFKNDDIDNFQLKASFFTKRNEFEMYIKSISGGHTPPPWATGCFYNGEICMSEDVGAQTKGYSNASPYKCGEHDSL